MRVAGLHVRASCRRQWCHSPPKGCLDGGNRENGSLADDGRKNRASTTTKAINRLSWACTDDRNSLSLEHRPIEKADRRVDNHMGSLPQWLMSSGLSTARRTLSVRRLPLCLWPQSEWLAERRIHLCRVFFNYTSRGTRRMAQTMSTGSSADLFDTFPCRPSVRLRTWVYIIPIADQRCTLSVFARSAISPVDRKATHKGLIWSHKRREATKKQFCWVELQKWSDDVDFNLAIIYLTDLKV